MPPFRPPRLSPLFAILFAGAVACASPSSAAWPDRPDSLVVLHTNDTHAHLFPYAVRGDGRLGGAAARAALIERMRRGTQRTLLLDAGDVFQGTAYYNFFRGVPDYRAMSLMR